MKLRIESSGEVFGGTKVFNAETGEQIKGVTSVTFQHKVNCFPRITIELISLEGVDLKAVGDADSLESPGKYSILPDDPHPFLQKKTS
jgi:hypothetical protein